MANKKLMIIDGNSIANRAFYGIRMLTAKNGQFTNAIYGYLNILFKHIEENKPDYICSAFDLSAPTFRHQMFDQYKAQRKGMPDELASQMPVLKQVLEAMGILVLQKEGYEADDIIGTIAEQCEKDSVDCMIVTGDKDDLQLATDKTRIYLTTTQKGLTSTQVYAAEDVKASYGITPTEFIDFKALMGDPSDNIPGVTGIGEKGALELIKAYGSIEKLYEVLDADNDATQFKGALRKKLLEGREMAFLSKQLATIDKAVPVDFSFSSFEGLKQDDAKVFALFESLEFKSFIKKMNLSTTAQTTDSSPTADFTLPKIQHITDYDSLCKWAEQVKATGKLIYQLYKSNGQICGIAVKAGVEAALATTGFTLTQDQIAGAFGPLFSDEQIQKIGHDTKEDIVLLDEYGINYDKPTFDTAIGAYILLPSLPDYQLAHLGSELLGITIPDEEQVLGKGKSKAAICDVESHNALELAASHVMLIELLQEQIKEQLEKNDQIKLYYEVELPLVRTLADMQLAGFYVDRAKLEEFAAQLSSRSTELTQYIYNHAGAEFNINSTKQLGEVLFEKLGLKTVKKTKTGYSTDAEVLEKLKGSHPIIELLLEYRQVTKIKSTYIDGLLPQIRHSTGRIHSSFNQTIAVTGRISSTEPNMQNIPIRHELGREVRKIFTACDEDHILIDADYSQIELRVLAHIADDQAMKNAFSDGIDIHTATAAQVFGTDIDKVTGQQRSFAKAVNFGIVYGIGEYSLSQDLHISVAEAKHYINSYLETYSGVRGYMERIKQSAREKGYVETLMKRRRYIPEITSANFNLCSFGERVALNTPIQGTAADIIKFAMTRVHNALKEGNYRSKLILQVHDELIVEAHIDERDAVCNMLKHEMEHAMELDVPLIVDMKLGRSWYETK